MNEAKVTISNDKTPSATSAESICKEDKELAEEYRQLGNSCFKQGFYEAAIENYTKAMNVNDTDPVYYTNRACAFTKQGKWANVVEDARVALRLDDENFKAHYFLGKGLCAIGEYEDGFKKLSMAHRLADSAASRFLCECATYRAKAERWRSQHEKKAEELGELKTLITNMLENQVAEGRITKQASEKRLEQMVELIQKEIYPVKVIPEYLCCKISMCLMREPVVTPSGWSYESKLLHQHFARNGHFDPVTMRPCRPEQTVQNYALKDAIASFVEEHPWAAEELC